MESIPKVGSHLGAKPQAISYLQANVSRTRPLLLEGWSPTSMMTIPNRRSGVFDAPRQLKNEHLQLTDAMLEGLNHSVLRVYPSNDGTRPRTRRLKPSCFPPQRGEC
jgi:hypothetical protein